MATGNLGVVCTLLTPNAGIVQCPYYPKNFGGMLLVPTGTAWTMTDILGVVAKINTGIANNNPNLRYIPIGKFDDFEDKSSETVVNQKSYGQTVFGHNGKYGLKFMYTNGGLDLHTELSKLNGNGQDRYDVMFFDHINNVILCTASGKNNVKGFGLDAIFTDNVKLATGGSDAGYSISVYLEDEQELNFNWRALQVDKAYPLLTTFTALKPTRLEIVSELGATAAKTVVVRVWSGGTNLYDYYSTELLTLTLWYLGRNTTGIKTVASAVTANPSTKSFTVFSTSMATTTAGEECAVYLETVTALTAANILKQANAEAATTAV
jgi:hypothetical protein